ncbi:MAG: riboflavin synthase [Bryobacterales bacterium]|nr:riboflavin synthase [Bryobacterales bacterium]
MFTGIVEEAGRIRRMERSSSGARIQVEASEVLSDLRRGGSIAVNGCCLTAVEVDERGFAADLSPETLARTGLGTLTGGDLVNLERPLLPTSRLSGHFVLGHVDGTGTVDVLDPLGDGNWWLSVRIPRDLLKYLVYKGSVAIDGISLTVASLKGDTIGFAIIPHTYEVTNLAVRSAGESVNIECDVLAKHVTRLLELRDGLHPQVASG